MRVLAVSSSEKSCSTISSLLREVEEVDVSSCISGATARRMVLDENWDIVVINYPLSDESGLELGEMILSESEAFVVMLMREDLLSSIGYEAEEAGIVIVSKPIIPPVFRQSIHLAQSTKKRLDALRREIRRLEMKVEEIKIVDKAKCMLISKNSMDEDSAHRFLLKSAMDKRISLRDAAASVLKSFKE